jgi:hypothetical protein
MNVLNLEKSNKISSHLKILLILNNKLQYASDENTKEVESSLLFLSEEEGEINLHL